VPWLHVSFVIIRVTDVIPIPANYGISHAHGTQVTCSTQAFLIYIMVVSHMYSAALSIYFLLIIRYKVREDHLAHTVEPILHFLALGWGYGSTLYAATATDIFNPVALQNVCAFGVSPPFCNVIPNMVCTRGQRTRYYTLVLFTVPTIIIFCFVLLMLMMIILTIRSQLRRNLLYAFRGDVTRNQQQQSSWKNNISQVRYFLNHSIMSRSSASFSNELSATNQAITESNYDNMKKRMNAIDDESTIPPRLSNHHNENDNDSPSPCTTTTAATAAAAAFHHASVSQQEMTILDDNMLLTTNSTSVDMLSNNNNNNNEERIRPSLLQISQSQQSQRTENWSSREQLLNQAIIQCFAYGFAYLLSITWTVTISILDLRGHGGMLLTKYYWVCID
jgi:hypothetical protein